MPGAGAETEQRATGTRRRLVPVGAFSVARRKMVLGYVNELAQALRLRDWDFEIAEEPASDDACAEIACAAGQKRARITLSATFFTNDGPWQRQTLVHELIHCHLAHTRQLASDSAAHLRGKAAGAAFFTGINLALEYATDGMADAFAPFVPLPEWEREPSRTATTRRRH